jgi:peroxiredoxin family protein
MPEADKDRPKQAGGGDRAARRSVEKLSIVVFSGDYERVHYALAMASAAAAVGKPVTLFFTNDATRALLKPQPDGAPGWAGLRGDADGTAPLKQEARRQQAGLAGLEELLLACVELGVVFMACEMGMRLARVVPESLRSDIPIARGGIVTFLSDASHHGAMLFV